MKNACGVRRFGISALLGLPAALLAHTLVFGDSHVVGGSFHAYALEGSAVFAVLAALLASVAAVRGSRCWTPHVGGTALAAGAWLAALELRESPHAIPVALCLFALAAAAAILAAVVHAFARAVVTVAQFFDAYAKLESVSFVAAFSARIANRRRALRDFTLFSRPPPALS